VVFCDNCDAVTAASEAVCTGCGVPLLDAYRLADHAVVIPSSNGET
jgi:hypothetical protein